MAKFKTISLKPYFNSPGLLKSRKSGPQWHAAIQDHGPRLPRGAQTCWGIPFALGPKDLAKKGVVVLAQGQEDLEVPLDARATHVCVLHFCNLPESLERNAAGGERLADYVLRHRDGSEHVVPIRRRFEINPFAVPWGAGAFAAAELNMPRPVSYDAPAAQWGWLQTGVTMGSPFGAWVYALENPRPEERLETLVLRGCSPEPVALLGVTLYRGPGHPLRHVPRRVYKLRLPRREAVTEQDLDAELDLGVITRLYAAPAMIGEDWAAADERGLGRARPQPEPGRDFLLEATGAEGATLTVHPKGGARRELPFGKAWAEGKAESEDKKVKIELLHPRTTWVHVTVVDDSTGQPTPTRMHLCGPHGEYLPPYGHHAVVNDRWFEDYGGDLQLGGQSFAYVPGRFQVELPVGPVGVEFSKGFEYEPTRQKVEIAPGQRELELRIKRWTDWRAGDWVTADTHVHFISPETAWLEGQGEGLNLINLLASQWGRLFTNVADITGAASGCSREDTLVWVGTENRHHLLGHISMLGTQGDPVFPMCDGGPSEAYLGDPDVTLLTEWAQKCREREGLVIRPHFPHPICEEPVYFGLKQLDGVELRQYANPDAGPLDAFCFAEWYRYLNCGYRVAAVGGTDKMSAGMPVGGARTYAKLDPNEAFAFENWSRAVRAGRTFTTSGPLIDLVVDGHAVGDEIEMPAGGGTLQVRATAECAWPIERLEVVVNGKVAAATEERQGARRLSLEQEIKVDGSCWIAARCGGRMLVHHCWPIHLGAHTSPVYVVAGEEELFSASDATYMLTLIDGGMTYLDTLSVRYDEERHRQMKALFEQARADLQARMRH